MLIRMFGLFGIVLGAAYLNEGTAFIGLLPYALSQRAHNVFFVYLLYVTWDFLFGLSLIVAGIGVLLLKNWARIMWLGLMPALVFVHAGVIVFNQLFRYGASRNYLIWSGMVLAVTVLSWWYFTKLTTRTRFAHRKEE
jgi:hypothetical protein